VIAEKLRSELGLPLLAKDALKETLGDVLGTRGRTESQLLGVAVFALVGALVRELLSSGVSLIVEGNFMRGSPAMAELPPARIAQVHVSAPPGLLRERLLERDAHRHPVHYDREAADEIADRAVRGEWLPLDLVGALIQVDTSTTVDVASIVAEIRSL
jgi:predicted kinase